VIENKKRGYKMDIKLKYNKKLERSEISKAKIIENVKNKNKKISFHFINNNYVKIINIGNQEKKKSDYYE
jgi:hypothetical protein